MNSAINLKSVVCKVWFAILLAALVQVGLRDLAHAQAKKVVAKPSAAKTATPALSLEAFVSQVREGNGTFQGAEAASEGATLRAEEADLLTRPTLIGNAAYIDDRRETGSPLTGNINRTQTYSLGIQQMTSFGLQGKLTYNMIQTAIPQSTFIVPNQFWTAGPLLELNQSLWRNGFGRATRANQQLISAQALATKYNNSFAQTELLSAAEAAYWRLALAREAVELSRDNITRAERLRSWSSGRQRSGLGDRSDFLQASTAYLARELELKASLDEEKAAARAFNTMRGRDTEEVNETLVAFNSEIISQRMKLPQRGEIRDDVRAAEQAMRLAEAQAKLGAEKNRPLVDVYGSVGYNGRDPVRGSATHESTTSENPTYSVGIKLEVPLDIGSSSDAVKGYKAEARAAQIIYDRRKFESERLWKDLSISFQDAISRYQLATQIEKSSREKMEYERVRHNRGRTTTFQVIQFETDYATAVLNRIRTQFEILNTYARLQTFAGGSQ